MAAAFNSEPGVTELLLDHGEDIHDGDTRDWTPLHHAAASNMTDVVALLLKPGSRHSRREQLRCDTPAPGSDL